ncbi:protein GLUTAMINE DUMPER 5 [Iris pallida]|uniref:Protein GLUTAMINE DUMPER 5 n=1 Tax=Iris pallida TaxID=29817 RepID=A0AAX6I8Z8_IRIPA|nr:protein GLUTAMINE DUMPER 5 [Iris pallida]
MRPGFPHEMAPSSSSVEHSSTWHSPVPYLFGGLAAMLGLIAFALLILACSYWRLSGFLDDDQDQHHHASSSKQQRQLLRHRRHVQAHSLLGRRLRSHHGR